ncbi:uncharacterized protein LOC105695952 [Orussus abietinus]|uniref:uncharacterized protein LOC105695952 n=1 Tax=Orussus abietinus TaxID=222816 RepID=UPI000624FCB2|nr:uncharacterized protein LOC105695952 [Orussus abietinus]
MCRSLGFRMFLLASIVLSSLLFRETIAEEVSAFQTVHNSNAAILNRLGLTPLRFPDGHHKKRLAGPEPPADHQNRIHQPYSRRHGHRDSHVYIVKLPASPPYYTLTKPHKKEEKTRNNLGLPVGFHSNGKPGKIYHWNLPVMKKMSEKRRVLAQDQLKQLRKRLQEEKKGPKEPNPAAASPGRVKTPVESKGSSKYAVANLLDAESRTNNRRLTHLEVPGEKRPKNTTNKMFRLEDDSVVYRLDARRKDRPRWPHLGNDLHGFRSDLEPGQKAKKHKKKAAMSYYAPMASKTSTTSIQKNFAGNGKPKAFYVMEKSRKPVYYHPLLP